MALNLKLGRSGRKSAASGAERVGGLNRGLNSEFLSMDIKYPFRMGSFVSTAKSNDQLVDILLEADYIKSSLIESVFRAVDRAEYFLTGTRETAYKDLAWQRGNLHISSPRICATAMEALELVPGLSFLNMGSGTGYFSTMVGLILGINGINHGIEIHADVIDYAHQRLEDFKKFSGAIDAFDFCEPKFMQ
uniref:Uncharacterized protein n=1 Tax=Dendroctonus ponderosae TaxID=77166 RepID=A0AAR5QIA0_DENPD